jgi:hypothetical protein
MMFIYFKLHFYKLLVVKVLKRLPALRRKLKDRRGDQRGGEWEPIGIPHEIWPMSQESTQKGDRQLDARLKSNSSCTGRKKSRPHLLGALRFARHKNSNQEMIQLAHSPRNISANRVRAGVVNVRRTHPRRTWQRRKIESENRDKA